MSLDPILWAMKDAPVADVEERAILIYMAEAADEDGCNSHKSQLTIAGLAILHDRTVRKRLAAMEGRGLIARGDQNVPSLLRIPADRRPVNYDLMIPFSWFSNIGRTNAYRANQGRPPLTPEERPDIVLPPPARHRADLGVSRPAKGAAVDAQIEHEGTAGLPVHPSNQDETAGLVVRPDYQSRTAGLPVPDGRTTSPTTLPLTHPNNSGSHLPLDPQLTEEPDSASSEEGGSTSDKAPDIAQISRWFVRLRMQTGGKAWTERDVEAALLGAIERRMGTLTLAAQALRELVTGADRYGSTDYPGRLLVDGGWWKAVKPKTVAARDRLAAEPRCQERDHGRYPAARCVPCMTDQYGQDEMEPDPAADAKAAAYTRAVRERQRSGLPPAGRQRAGGDVQAANAS